MPFSVLSLTPTKPSTSNPITGLDHQVFGKIVNVADSDSIQCVEPRLVSGVTHVGWEHQITFSSLGFASNL